MKTQQFSRKPFDVTAVQLTEDNLEEVAKWCQGDVMLDTSSTPPTQYIKVRVLRVMNERQTRAYVGDWVLYAGKGYKVYTDRAFQDCFEKSEENSEAETAPAEVDEPAAVEA